MDKSIEIHQKQQPITKELDQKIVRFFDFLEKEIVPLKLKEIEIELNNLMIIPKSQRVIVFRSMLETLGGIIQRLPYGQQLLRSFAECEHNGSVEKFKEIPIEFVDMYYGNVEKDFKSIETQHKLLEEFLNTKYEPTPNPEFVNLVKKISLNADKGFIAANELLQKIGNAKAFLTAKDLLPDPQMKRFLTYLQYFLNIVIQ